MYLAIAACEPGGGHDCIAIRAPTMTTKTAVTVSVSRRKFAFSEAFGTAFAGSVFGVGFADSVSDMRSLFDPSRYSGALKL
jgi:hypothetical protein